MDTLERLDAGHLRLAVIGYRDALRAHQEAINRLNVYPVPDGDTGTNMALTLESVVSELASASDMPTTCRAISHGALMGARGNSGVILSQILRGIADGCKGLEAAGPAEVAGSLEVASEAAYQAVMRPVEGTILTVVRAAAAGGGYAAGQGKALVDVVDGARAEAVLALERTPELLPVLKEAAVVDAGGAGFVLLLDALLQVIAGRPIPEPEPGPPLTLAAPGDGARTRPAPGRQADRGADRVPRVVAARELADMAHAMDHVAVGDLRYEVMYFLEAADETIPAFKEVWASMGDSIVVVGGDGLWNCHIHTDDIGAAIEAALDCGRPRNIRVGDLLEQVEEERWVREGAARADAEPLLPHEPVATAVVAVGTGGGIGRLFRSVAVQSIVAGGQSLNPSTAEVLEAVEASPSDAVIVLPNNRNVVPVAEQVGELTTKRVRVVATDSVTEGLAAAFVYDPQGDLEENVEAMVRAVQTVVTGEVTRAVRPSASEVGPIAAGDYLGVSRRGIEVVASTVDGAAIDLLELLVGDDHEIVTVIEGEGASPAATRRITEWLTEHCPQVVAEVHHGGQPLYPYLFSIE